MKARFDVIVVGAGPAGLTAAHVLAKAGLSVVVFERGEYPGAKNLFGGVFYQSEVLNTLIPEFWTEAPVERFVTRRMLTFMSPKASFSLDYRNADFGSPPYNGFTLLRSKFDRWYAEKAEQAGALVVTETVVDDIITSGSKVVGIRARREKGEVYANIVVAADGVNSFLAQKAGLRSELAASHLAVGVKEVISLPAEVIEARFGVSGNEGVASEYIGFCTEGVEGGGFLYTNRNSLSLGIVVKVSALTSSKKTIAKMLDDFKAQPVIRNFIKDGVLKEYCGHLIPEGGASMTPKLYTDGMMVAGDAAGFVCNTGITLEGVNFAIASGYAAAQAALLAHEKADFSRTTLAHYEELLKKSFVLQDLQTFRGTPQFLGNPRLYGLYPDLICGVAERLLRVDGKPRKKIAKLLHEQMREQKLSPWDVIKDGLQGARTLVWP